MTTIATINNTTYTTDDFNSVNYANKFQQLIGDIFDYTAQTFSTIGVGTYPIATGSITLTIANTASVNLKFASGQWVYACPMSITSSIPPWVSNFMFGIITAVTATTITITVVSARGTGTYNAWYLSCIGNMLTNPSSVAVVNGGTGVSTAAAARAAIGYADVSARAETIFDDFYGRFLPQSNGYQWFGEHFMVSTLSNPCTSFNATTNPNTFCEFLTNPQATYPGDNRTYNSPPAGGNSVMPIQNDWSSHPGVIGFSSVSAGAKATMLRRWYSNNEPGYLNFPFIGDLLEFCFMFPYGENIGSNGAAGFSVGTVLGNANGYCLTFNIGHGGALPFTNPLSPTITVALPTVQGVYDAASVIAYDPASGSPTVYTDSSSQLTTWSPSPGVWYKVRLTSTQCVVYREGQLQGRVISGWTAPPTPDSTKPSQLWIGFSKTGGSQRVTVLLDYIYLRHSCSR